MRNKFIGLLVVIIFISLIKGCSDTVQPPPPGGDTDPGILITDEFGNELGGDTTDWCLHGAGFRFGAAYPNPTNGIVHVRFNMPVTDTVKLYFLNSPNDSDIFFSGPVMAGSYTVTINDSTSQYANSYRRLYISSKQFSSSQYCRFYGDIKFVP